MIHSYYFFDTYWTPEIGLIEHVFKDTTEYMGDEDFIDCCEEQIKLYETMKQSIRCILFDSTLFFYEISYDAQDWCNNNNWNKYVQEHTNVTKVGNIYSDSVCVQLTKGIIIRFITK
jgi:hypothetical protein